MVGREGEMCPAHPLNTFFSSANIRLSSLAFILWTTIDRMPSSQVVEACKRKDVEPEGRGGEGRGGEGRGGEGRGGEGRGGEGRGGEGRGGQGRGGEGRGGEGRGGEGRGGEGRGGEDVITKAY